MAAGCGRIKYLLIHGLHADAAAATMWAEPRRSRARPHARPLMRRGCMEEPVQFEHRPFRADHAVALLSRPYPQAKVQAADLGLFALMTFRLAEPLALSDLADPADLCYVRIARGELRIGSLTRHADLLSSAVGGEHIAHPPGAGGGLAHPGAR